MIMKIYDAVKKRILELLYKKNFSIHKLAVLSGVAPSTIKNILYGKSQNPGISTLKMLCDGLDVSIVEFFETDEFLNLEQELG